MDKLSKKEIKDIALLARLELKEKEQIFYAKELSAVLGYIDKLDELDTEKVEPTSSVAGLTSILREDKKSTVSASVQKNTVAKLLKSAPILEKGYIKVKAVFNR